MKTFTIQVVETLERNVSVKAKNIDEAYDKVEQMYHNQEIVLDAEDYADTKFYEIKDLNELIKEKQKKREEIFKRACEILPKETELNFITSYNENLNDCTQEIASSIEKKNDFDIYQMIEDCYREQTWECENHYLKELKEELLKEFNKEDVEDFMELRQTGLLKVIEDRRVDNIIPDLCKQSKIRARIQFYSNYEMGYPLWELRAVTYSDYFKQTIDILNINPAKVKEELTKRKIVCEGKWPNIENRNDNEYISAEDLVNMLIECPNYYQLTFVGILPLEKMFEQGFNNNKITINKGTMVLLYNHYNGGGTCAEAFLKRDLDITLDNPKSKYNKFKLILDVPAKQGGNGYCTEEVYGFAYRFEELFHYQPNNQKKGDKNDTIQ